MASVMLLTSSNLTANAYDPARLDFEFRNEYVSANQICEICWNSYNKGAYGPIIIAQGKLQKGDESTDVYVVTLCGTELIKGQSTGLLTDVMVGILQNENNAYTQNVVSAIKKVIPADSNLVLYGHSLGGMVCQQVAANSYVKSNYNILNTLTFGSPVISGGRREGMVKRLGDTADFVPYLSVTGQIVRQVSGLNREDGGYNNGIWTFQKGWEAHNHSYLREDVWGDYDVIGVKGGNATLTYDIDSIRFEHAPAWKLFCEQHGLVY